MNKIESITKEEFMERFNQLEKTVTHNTFNKLIVPNDETKEKEQLSPKAKEIKEVIIKENFGCRRNSVAKLFSILLDEKIEIEKPKKISKNRTIKMTMIVIEDLALVGLCYEIGPSTFSVLRPYPDTEVFRYSEKYRKATLEEIQIYFNKWRKIFESIEEDDYLKSLIQKLPNNIKNELETKLFFMDNNDDEEDEEEDNEDDDEEDWPSKDWSDEEWSKLNGKRK